MIKEIAFTAYPAKDVATMRKWYEDKLGLAFDGASKRTASKSTIRAISTAGISVS